ncbi:hypothetical protein [Rossellomorea sp. y25]|uniref:hypothetical protein n=1 Tax=Rossellomorea sp. y25 TaxID=3118174 RepID=UPI0030DEA115
MVYYVSMAYQHNFPEGAIQHIEDRLYGLDIFSLGDLNAFIYNDDFTEKGLYNYLVGDISPEHLEQLVVLFFTKLPSKKNYPDDLTNWFKERNIKA